MAFGCCHCCLVFPVPSHGFFFIYLHFFGQLTHPNCQLADLVAAFTLQLLLLLLLLQVASCWWHVAGCCCRVAGCWRRGWLRCDAEMCGRRRIQAPILAALAALSGQSSHVSIRWQPAILAAATAAQTAAQTAANHNSSQFSNQRQVLFSPRFWLLCSNFLPTSFSSPAIPNPIPIPKINYWHRNCRGVVFDFVFCFRAAEKEI